MKNSIRKHLIVLSLACCTMQAWSVQSWFSRAVLPGLSWRWNAVGFSINGKGYLGTGLSTLGYHADFWQYDPATNAWSQKATVPGFQRARAVGFASTTKGYIGTGDNGFGATLKDFYEYDPVANTWTQKGDFAGGFRRGATCFFSALLSKGYVACGQVTQVGNYMNDFWEYDPVVDTWTPKANFSGTARSEAVGFNGGIYSYVGTGYDGTVKGDMFRYDHTANTWTTSPFPVPARTGASLFVTTNGIFIGLGVDGGGNYLNDFWVAGGVFGWTQKPNFPGPGRAYATSFSFDHRGYFVSGTAGVPIGDNWEFDDHDVNITTTSGVPFNNPFICMDGTWPVTINFSSVGAGSFGPGNVFTLQMSDGSGNFGSPYVLGTVLNSNSGSVTTTLPILPSGIYTFRVVASNPPVIGNPGGTVYSIFAPGIACDDNDPCTTGDTYDFNCACVGLIVDTDGDLTPDGCDGCPLNPGLTAPIVWHEDLDMDGLGDPANGVISCIPPIGFVSNGFDNCPGLFGSIGDPCDDNVPCTLNDVITPACVCAGIAPDTDNDGWIDCLDNCPYVYGVTGFPCNDGNPYTSGDVIDPNCVCTGTCNGAPVTLTLTTDINGAQTTWNIVNSGTNTVVCTGTGYLNSSTITASCCLANGCYDLRVYDSFGDGINPGGFVLRDVANNRIIDNAGNGPNFTTLSEVRDATNTPVSFCVPMGTDAMMPGSCDQVGLTINSVVQCQINAAVSAQLGITNTTSGYQFWVFNPNVGFSRRIFFSHAAPGTGWPGAAPVPQRCSYFRLNAMSGAPTIQSNTLLNVRVRSRVAGVNAEFGPACRLAIGTPFTCSSTQLTTTPTPIVSCGATGVNRLTGVLWSNNVLGANKYQFEFVNANTLVFLRNISSPTRNLNMNTWGGVIPLPTPFIPYNIRVRVSFDNGVTYCPWGPLCQVTFTFPPADTREMETLATDGVLHVWPNPNNGDQLFISIDDLGEEVSTATIDVIDIFGKRVMNETVAVDGARLNAIIKLNVDLADGLYVVNITAGDRVFTERLIIAK